MVSFSTSAMAAAGGGADEKCDAAKASVKALASPIAGLAQRVTRMEKRTVGQAQELDNLRLLLLQSQKQLQQSGLVKKDEFDVGVGGVSASFS